MAFLRHANAIVVHPSTTQAGWSKVRTARVAKGEPAQNLVAQASEILGKPFDPKDFLLTHCTLVASVDVVDVPNVKLGSLKEDGKRINRKYSNYRVTAETDKLLNNNFDGFPREVLLKSYKTLIGGQNFAEHVQIESLSKGRIIDAVARDIGESIYVDILVATDRKHTELISDIESGRMSTLSMGCSCEETTCTRCGNVAIDETELCEHIRYAKGNRFIAEDGKHRRQAEICGHESIDPTGGVTFIEASWVGSPAFTGAVMRNIITPEELNSKMAKQVQEVLSSPPPQWVGGNQHTASSDIIIQDAAIVGKVSDRKAAFDFGDPETPEAPETPEKQSPDGFKDIEDRVMQVVLDRVERRVKDELDKKKSTPNPEDSSMAPNDSLIRAASTKLAKKAYTASVSAMIKVSTSEADLINKIATLDASFGLKSSVNIYRIALYTGAISKYGSVEGYLKVCRDTLGRPMTQDEGRTFIRLGRILTIAAQTATPDRSLT